MATMKASTRLSVHATCPYCEFTGDIFGEPDDAGRYDNMWNGGKGGFRTTCPSCGKIFVIEQAEANDVQHLALVLLGEADPTPHLDDEAICEAVAKQLTASGFTAESQYTGGGIWCVSINEPARPNAAWLCGMSADEWGGTLMEADSYAPYEGPEYGGEMQLLHCKGVSSDSQNVLNIAEAIAVEIRMWRMTHGGRSSHARA
jgi:hypothetical protein